MASFLAKQPRAMDSTEEMERTELLLQYQHGFLISKVMFTACELGVFDLLLESGEPLSCTTIAERLGTSPSGMERLLGACVGLKLLRTERKDEQVFYANTELSSLYVVISSPKSQYYHTVWFSEIYYLSFNYLADAVREGKNQLEKLGDSKNFYNNFYRSEEYVQKFMGFMNSAWSLWGRDVIAAFDLSPFPRICDVGGSSGALAKECISLYPNCTVTIFDLPDVVRISKKYFVSEDEPRICFHEGESGFCVTILKFFASHTSISSINTITLNLMKSKHTNIVPPGHCDSMPFCDCSEVDVAISQRKSQL